MGRLADACKLLERHLWGEFFFFFWGGAIIFLSKYSFMHLPNFVLKSRIRIKNLFLKLLILARKIHK